MTSQERIENYGNRFFNERAKEFSIMFSDNLAYQKQLEVGYLNGATEQRKIDVEKACEWLRENVRPYYKFSIESFRKAMESEE